MDDALIYALHHITAALAALDAADAPGDIGAHLDLGLHRIEEELGILRSNALHVVSVEIAPELRRGFLRQLHPLPSTVLSISLTDKPTVLL